jgi:hypothetical protein
LSIAASHAAPLTAFLDEGLLQADATTLGGTDDLLARDLQQPFAARAGLLPPWTVVSTVTRSSASGLTPAVDAQLPLR